MSSLTKRSTPSPSPPQNASTRDLKQRVITCLNKLSDRDTYAIATTELESIARNLSHDSLSPFLNCIYYTDPSQKSPVRKQCVRLLGFVSEIHGDSLSPYLSKMISNIVRRLRDSDSNVRSACVDSVTIMAAQISRPPFSVFLKPLTEAIFVEQDQNSQSGSALCLASAIEASPDPDLPQLQRFLPRLMKLLKSDSFKAKPALLNLITSIVGVGGASNNNLLVNLIPCLVELLSSEDWAVRKASAETLARSAVMERDLLSEFKSSCLSTFESRRFDKVKGVRDTMNLMIEAWKDVPDVSDEVSPPSQSKSCSRENASDGRFPPGSRSSVNRAFDSPETRKKISPTSRVTPPDTSSMTTARQRSPLKGSNLKSSPAMFRKLDRKKPTNWKVEISVPHAAPSKEVCQDDLKGKHSGIPESTENENDRWCQKLEVKRAIFNKNGDDKMHKFGGFMSGSRVVPLHHQESIGSTVLASNATEELHGNNKNNEDMSLIRKQLVQIENQQSSLLDLLQKFMGSSQDGMRTLETRVHGLELALDEISYDLAISTGRMSNPETAGNTCCRLPGAEFLSSKFWKRTEGRYSTSRYSTSRFSSSGGTPLVDSLRNMADRDQSAEHFNMESRRIRPQGGGGFVVNPLANSRSESRGNSEVYLNRMPNSARNQVGNGSRLDVAPPITGIPPAKVISRSSA